MAEKNGVYEVTLPDGRVYEVTAPVGTPKNQLVELARESELSRRTEGFGVSALDVPLSALNEFVIGGARGISGMTKAISDPIIEAGLNVISPGYGTQSRQAAEEQRLRLQRMAERETVARPSALAQETGATLASIGAGALKLPSVAATAFPRLAPIVERAIQGAVGAQAVETPEMTRGEAAALGAGVNVALPPALRVIGDWAASTRPVQYLSSQLGKAAAPIVGALDEGAASLRRAVGLAPEPTPSEAFLPSVQQAQQAATSRLALPSEVQQAIPDVTEALGPEAAQRLRNFARIGVTQPTAGMITREPGMWSYERNVMKRPGVGEPVRDAIIKVNNEINTAVDDLIGRVGVADDVEKVGIQASEALRKKQEEMQKVVGQLYRNAREQYGEKSAGPVQNFLDKLEDPNLVDNADFDTFRESVNNRLRRFGMLGDSGLPRKDAVMSVKQAEEMRRFIRGLGSSADPNILYIRGELIEALDDDVVAGFGSDAFREARSAAKARFAEFKDTLAGKIGEGVIKSEQVTKKLMSEGTGIADVRKLKSSLLSGEPDQIARGQQAWSSIGAQALTDLFQKSRTGDNLISGTALRKQFNNNIPKFRELLTREEFVQLNRIVRAAGDANIDVDFASINRSGTAAELESIFSEAVTNPRTPIQNMINQVALLFTPASGAGNVALMLSQQASEAAAQRAAAQTAASQAALATRPADLAEQVIRGRFTQPARQPVQGLTAPGLISQIYNAENPPTEPTEYSGSWVWNPETQSAQWVPFSEQEKSQMRMPR